MESNAKTGTCAARVLPLGVTAYGETQNKAFDKVVRMVTSAVKAHRKCGDVADWLDNCGVTWSWESDYKGPLPIGHAERPQYSTEVKSEEHAMTGGPWEDLSGLTGLLPIAA